MLPATMAAQLANLAAHLTAMGEREMGLFVAQEVEAADLVLDHRSRLRRQLVDEAGDRLSTVCVAEVDSVEGGHRSNHCGALTDCSCVSYTDEDMPTSRTSATETAAASVAPARSKRDAGRQLAELDAQLAEHLPKSELDALVRMTRGIVQASDSPHQAQAPRPTSIVTGHPASSAQSVVVAQRANLLRSFALRRSMLEDALGATDVAALLGSASRQTPHDRVVAGSLLAIKDGGRLRYPVWQFDPEGPDGVVEGLPDVLAELPAMTQLGRISWFVTSKRGLDGRTPIDALRGHEVDRVIAEARATHSG